MPVALEHPGDDAPVLFFELQILRHGGPEAEPLGVAGVDAAYHRLGDAVERLPAEASPDKAGNALVAAAPARDTRSSSIRSFPGHENRGEVKNGVRREGASMTNPSGISTRSLPRRI